MLTVRELRANDNLSAVLQLCRMFFIEYAANHGEFFDTEEITDDDIAVRFRDSIHSENATTIIALDDGEIVGYALIAVREQPRFYKVKQIGAVSGLMVAPEYRGRGIGSKLLDAARIFFKDHGIKYFTLYTAVSNRDAIEFYESAGLMPLQTIFVGET